MRVALMQPYFFPYLGYFALMAAADVFVAYDNVQYSRPGWINRNRILRDHAPEWWTATVTDAPHTLDINQRHYSDWGTQRGRLLERLAQRYQRAPQRATAMALVESALPADDDNVARCNTHLLTRLARALGLRCEIRSASAIPHDMQQRGERRVLALCAALGATEYVNSPGGQELYSGERFAAAGVALGFVQSRPQPYAQFGGEFVPGLSIVDALMFLPLDEVRQRIDEHTLQAPAW